MQDNKVNQYITVFVLGLFFVASVFSGTYLFRQFKTIYSNMLSPYYTQETLVIGTPRSSRGIIDGRFVRLFYPNGGRKLTIGEPYIIFWEYAGINSFVISLQNEDADKDPLGIISVVYKNKEIGEDLQRGVYSWNVGELSSGEYLDPSAGWRMVIADEENPETVYDLSDKFFALIK